MPRRPREPLNPEMRAQLRKRLRRVVPPPVEEPPERPTIDDGFRDTILTKWVRIPEDLSDRERHYPAVASDETRKEDHELDAQTQRFCQILVKIKQNFSNNNRPYAALLADRAIALVKQGKQDDINPGLWSYVTAHESKRRDSQSPA